MLETPEKVRELQRKLYQKAKQEKEYRMDPDCESLWKKMIGKPYSGKLNVRFEVAGDGEVLWRTYTGTKLETADTAKGIPKVTRHSLTLPKGCLSFQ